MRQPQPDVQGPEEAVPLVQHPVLVERDDPRALQFVERLQGAARPRRRVRAAMEELQVLHRELHVHHAPPPHLQVQAVLPFPAQLLLHPHPQPVDLLRRVRRQGAFVDEAPGLLLDPLSEVAVPRDEPALQQRLPLPQVRGLLMVPLEGLQRGDQRARVPRGAQPRVEAVDEPLPRRGREDRDHPLGDLGEIFVVGELPEVAAASSGLRGALARPRVKEDDVEVAVIGQLLRPELPHPEDAEERLRPRRRLHGDAEATPHLADREEHRVGEENLRQRGELEHPLLQRQAPRHVVNADPKRLEVLEAPQLVQLLLEVVAPRQRLGEAGAQVGLRLDQRGEVVPQKRVQQLRVAKQEAGEEAAASEQAHERLDDLRLLVQEGVEHRPRPDGGEEPLHVGEREVGIGALRYAVENLGPDLVQVVARALGDPDVGRAIPEDFQVPLRRLDVAEPQPGEQRRRILRGASVQEERLHLPGDPRGLLPPRAAEEPGVDPVNRRRVAVERGEQRRGVGETHRPRQPREVLLPLWQDVGLPLPVRLDAVLETTQEVVGDR